MGDGDFIMGCQALWTAAHYRLPVLIIVANNGSYFNDEVHQDTVAGMRGRPRENRWIGQHIDNPRPSLAALAESLGLVGYGPVADASDLGRVLREAVGAVRAGGAVVVDVHVVERQRDFGASAGWVEASPDASPERDA
jgi:thiamine pyrophosphate-dependent acetolactate synthase large subunit-like protein